MSDPPYENSTNEEEKIQLQPDDNNHQTPFIPKSPRKNESVDNDGRPLDGDANDAIPILETPEERRMRKKSHFVVYVTCFVMSLGFSIVLTGVWPYMKQLNPNSSKEFLGWVVAANPLGQMIASPILGWCGNRIGSNRIAFISTIIAFMFGNIMYAILPLTTPYSDYLLVTSRFIVGVSSANIAICRSYIVSASKLNERTTSLAVMAASQSLGFIIGPSTQAALAFASESMGTSLDNSTTELSAFDFNSSDVYVALLNAYSLAGWTCAVLGLLTVFLFLPCIFEECDMTEKEAKFSQIDDQVDQSLPIKRDYFAIVLHLFGFFIVVLIFVLLETLAVPIVLDLYGWTDVYSVKAVGIAFTVMGVLSFFMFAVATILSKKFGERKVYILLGILPLAVSTICMFPMGTNYPKIKYCDSTVMNSTLEDQVDTFLNSSTRVRRGVASFGASDCVELGCPATQLWCFDTPIIEIPQIILGCTIASASYPVAFALSGAIFSKMLGFGPQGVWMGVLTSIGGFSRVVGPVIFTYVYTILGTRWTLGLQSIFLFAVFGLSVAFYKRFAPFQSESMLAMKEGKAR